MTVFKKKLSLCLAVLMCFGIFPVFASADTVTVCADAEAAPFSGETTTQSASVSTFQSRVEVTVIS